MSRFTDLLMPGLQAAAARGDRLIAVSLTMPDHNRGNLVAAAQQFLADVVQQGAPGALLARDVAEDGKHHWYGLVCVAAPQGARVALQQVANAWIWASRSSNKGFKVQPITAWGAFGASGGDPKACAGSSSHNTFELNLGRVLDYAFKPWPAQHGARQPIDVLERGIFCGLTRAAATAGG